ncbi:3-oxoacyl-[acyl-carrier-protein] reductase [Aix galericulata]|nr:3-oxoacyl-[acyl-carrier-protein] reductase [Aix galericulata]
MLDGDPRDRSSLIVHNVSKHKREIWTQEVLLKVVVETALHAEDEHFDMVFIDADQRSAVNYYSFVMDNHLLRMDGVICVENTLMKGQVYLENISEENVLAVRKLNTMINSDPRVEQIILPVQNGLSVIRRSPAPPDAVIETKKEVVRDDIFWGYNKRRILDRLRLDDKVAYVTGGGQGIGRAFAHALGEAGAKVAVVDLVLEKAEAVAHELSLKVPHPQKQLAYNASKAGVVKLTQTLGTEWIDRGVKVNCISPGIVDTALIRSEALQPLVQRWLADIPAGRLARGTDLQAAVVFLASEASDYMTGHNLVIEGGQSLWCKQRSSKLFSPCKILNKISGCKSGPAPAVLKQSCWLKSSSQQDHWVHGL